MTFLKSFLFFLIIPLFAFSAMHKYYVSVTQINYVEEKASVQIISRIFIDDFENVLRKRYNDNITLAGKNEPKTVDAYIARYLNEKIKIKINNKAAKINFIGKEYNGDIMQCYLEIEGVKAINAFEITNQLLFDLFQEQQNIVKTKINETHKSFLFILQKDHALLNFD
ncbi:DUF6702 family protein [Hwangdonia lutea]|uniref:DUF6702 family protein n=1 Tax=Hwangdonia lutea TaxID=3075823 RepID=A0AA97HQ63_9FLAO|nr:DUF6702 family protein [Hwangdonia sp. SCSIO 19198]WOD42358.1 DUF6702 family protein [Hwangdonia sp. SCSIO 19198]